MALDAVLYEYWHSVASVDVFRQKNIPCVLDMHNLLWQSLSRQYQARKFIPQWWKDRSVQLYRTQEEDAWNRFDGVITINAEEHCYVQSKVADHVRLFYAPMGTDLSLWPYSWQPSSPPRVVYFGGLGSPHNRQDALSCYQHIMPIIWEQIPEAELWLVGSNPPDDIKALPNQDSRIIVTGFVNQVQDVLKTMSVLLCPWTGTYGFRSRLIEAMALGIPVVASPDAVHGMDLTPGHGLFIEANSSGMAQTALRLLLDKDDLQRQSKLARRQTEEKFSYQATYEALASNLLAFINEKRQSHLPDLK
ncbi:MAG: glycosyltransferase family 4 protein [Chloroflexota bacterium]